jgi:hypothetical protein
VRGCIPDDLGGSPCGSPYAERRFRRQPQGGPLNPDLGKLLEPMTAKDGKTD